MSNKIKTKLVLKIHYVQMKTFVDTEKTKQNTVCDTVREPQVDYCICYSYGSNYMY